MYDILKGLTVVEGASFVAAPSAGLYLSQFGADVIRFDQIGGGPDFGRWPCAENGASFYWEGLNKGKKSVALDLRSPEGRELAIRLITADGSTRGLFLTNFPVDGFLSHGELAKIRPDLITVRVMGRADGSAAVDYTVNCAVGYPFMTGPEGSTEPVNHVLPAWDLLTGAYAAFSMVSAERHRQMTGMGGEIRTPLTDIAAATLSNLGNIAEVVTTGADRPPIGNNVYGMFGRDFVTADGVRVMIAAVTHLHWVKLIELLGVQSAVQAIQRELNVDFAKDEGARYTHRNQLAHLIAREIGKRDFGALVADLDRSGVLWGRFQTVKQAIADPTIIAGNPIFAEILHPSGHSYPASGAPATLQCSVRADPRPAPRLGQHSEEVLVEALGLSESELGGLIDRGIVGTDC